MLRRLVCALFMAGVVMAACAPMPQPASPVVVSPTPDSSSILYLTLHPEEKETTFRVVQLPLATLVPHTVWVLPPSPDQQRWFFEPAPDFSWVAYYPELQKRLFLIRPDGAEQREVPLAAQAGVVLWAPDSQKFLAGGQLFDVGGNLLRDMPAEFLTHCAWANDSSALACSKREAHTGNLGDVLIVPVDEAPYLLTDGVERGAHPVFSPDSQRVAYFRLPDNVLMVRNRDGSLPKEIYPPYPLFKRDRQAFIAPIVTGQILGLLFAPKNGYGNLNTDGPLAWSPDGTQIAFDCNALCVTDLATIRTRVFAESRQKGHMTNIAWSPDGTHLAIIQTRMTDRDHSFVVHAGQMTGVALAEDTQYIVWSPNSARLAFSTADGLYLINADGTGQTLLAEGAHFFWLAWPP